MRVGVEVGGTFTDLVSIGSDGVRVTKVPSTPDSPDRGAFNALEQSGLAIDTVTDLSHGSTVATTFQHGIRDDRRLSRSVVPAAPRPVADL